MKVLVIAPHPDDEILGCGGIMARYIAEGNEVYVCIATSSKNEEARVRNERYARSVHEKMGVKRTFFLDFAPCSLNLTDTRTLNKAIADVINEIHPEEVFIPFYGDMHTDHAAAAASAMVGLRPLAAPFVRAVYMYETLSETGWNFTAPDLVFNPNVYFDISSYIEDKICAMNMYGIKVQQDPHPRSPEGIRALAKYRGGTVGKFYAEAFMCVRSVN